MMGENLKAMFWLGQMEFGQKYVPNFLGAQDATYSNYTCYSGLTDRTLCHLILIPLVWEQWNAFHKEPPKSSDPPTGKKNRLLQLFGSWCSEVNTLISETPENMVLRIDIYDRDMIFSWGNGQRVTLLGDAAHPRQPNLGQGGCMAIEDSYQLILELEKVDMKGSDGSLSKHISSALKRYERRRMFRVTTVHAVSRMASEMLSTYNPSPDLGLTFLFNLIGLQIITNPAIHVTHEFMQFPAVHELDDSRP